MRLIRQELIKIKNRALWSWYGFSHVAKTEGSLWQWIIANIVSGSLTIFLPITYTQQALILAGGILILAAECMNTAIERVVDDISMDRTSQQQSMQKMRAVLQLQLRQLQLVWLGL